MGRPSAAFIQTTLDYSHIAIINWHVLVSIILLQAFTLLRQISEGFSLSDNQYDLAIVKLLDDDLRSRVQGSIYQWLLLFQVCSVLIPSIVRSLLARWRLA